MEMTTGKEEHRHSAKEISKPVGIRGKLRAIWSDITVEPIIPLFLFPSALLALSTANLNLEKACRVNLQFNATVCDGLSIRNTTMYTPDQENMVQIQVSSMNAWKSIIQSVLPASLLLIFGAWSDKHKKRKPFMILPITGEIVTVTGLILCNYFFYELPMQVTGVFESLPTSITGGWFTMYMALFSYIASISTVESRTIRIGAVNMCTQGSVMIGMALSGILYRTIGLYAIFSMSLAMYVFALVYTIAVIKEKTTDETDSTSMCDNLKDFFNVQHIQSTFMVAFKKRERNYRTRIFVVMLLVIFILGPIYGEITVIYLFTRKQFQWSEIEFSIYYTLNVVLHLIGTIFSLTVLTKWLKLHDTTTAIICYVGKFFSAFVFAFAPDSTIFCIGVVVEMLSGTTYISLRSIATKLVPEHEQGKLNAVTAIFEAITPLAYGSMYNLVYSETIDKLPGAFYFIACILSLPTIALLTWLRFQSRLDAIEDQNKEKLMNEKEPESNHS